MLCARANQSAGQRPEQAGRLRPWLLETRIVPLTWNVTRFAVKVRMAALMILALALPVGAAPVQVDVSVSPAQIGLGDAAQLAVTVQGSQTSQPVLPRVDGLDFTPIGQSSSFQSIDGAMSANVSYLYQVSASRAGTFTIPAIRAGQASSQPVKLQVLKSGVASSRTPGHALPPPNFNPSQSSTANQAVNRQKQMAFLCVLTPKHKLYVGEQMPVQIKAYFRAGMSAGLDGLPALSSDAFTMTKLTDKPTQTQEIVNGAPYTVLTWPAALSAVKAGDYSLSLELPVRVRVQERAGSRQRRDPFGMFGDDPFFNDPFFDSFFSNVTEKQIKLPSGVAAMKIEPLPAAGRPVDFSGAVGQFNVQAEVSPRNATAGDPLTLTLTVNGQGNFDRVTTTGLPETAAWKTYKPSSEFEPADSVGLSGKKAFTQAIVPEQSGHLGVPALAFSYFDPDTGKYVTRHTTPLAVDIAPSTGVPEKIATASAAIHPATSPHSSPSKDELFPNMVEPGRFVASLQPVLLRPAFLAVPGMSLALFACGLWFVKRRDQRAADPARTRQKASAVALRNNLSQMDRAAAAGDEPTFFACARRVLQERLAQAWHLSPNAVTLAEINRRLNGGGENICAVFRAADQTAYAGSSPSPVALHEWQQRVHEQLKHVEES